MSKSALVRGLTMITARQDIFSGHVAGGGLYDDPATAYDDGGFTDRHQSCLLRHSLNDLDLSARSFGFSVFPSLLLITTLYRLALTISTTRLVLLQHDAGEIVEAFGQFVVGGNLAVGMIILPLSRWSNLS